MVQIDSFYPGIVFSSFFKIIGRLGFWRWYHLLLSYFFLKSSFNSLYDPFDSPYRGQKPSLPLKKAFFYLSVSPARRAPLSPQAPLPQEAGDVTALLGARDRFALRLADHQRSAPDFAGWDRLDAMLSIPNLKPNLHESAKSKD